MARNHNWKHSYIFQSDTLGEKKKKDKMQEEKEQNPSTQDELWLKTRLVSPLIMQPNRQHLN